MKTKIRVEVTNRKKKNYVQIYMQDPELLLHTYIVREEDTLSLSDFYTELSEGGEVTDFS